MRRLITAALLALALGSAQAATQMEQLAKQMHPSEFPAQIEKLLNSGKAAQALELAIRKNERSPQLRFMRAVALENLTRSEEAVRELKQLIIDYPEIPEPYNNLAVIEAGLGNLEEAVAHLKQALRINPDFALARKNLGDVYLALAREAYEQAVVKLPNNHVLERRLNTLKSLETAR
jgi:tetratricopeptide (TPR) repeat protein